MIVLVTGATGFLGSHVVRRLLKMPADVRAIHRPTSSFDLVADVRERVDWLPGDVTNPDSLYRATDGVDAVIHAAACLEFRGPRSRGRLRRVNVDGTAHVVNAALAARVDRLLHVSSISALGRAENGRTDASGCLDESAAWIDSRLNSEYGRSKYLAELEVRRGVAEGLDAVIVNPSLIMGFGRSGENTTLLAEKIRERTLPFVPRGSTNTVDVDDVTDGIIRALERGDRGTRYLLTGENLSWHDIIGTLADALAVRPPRLTLPPSVLIAGASCIELVSRVVGTTPLITRETVRLASADVCYDNTRAREELGCRFRPFTETAARIAASLSGAGR